MAKITRKKPTKPRDPAKPGPGRIAGTPLTSRELAARRANAQRSTGPRTEEGKTASSRNAWKHGMTSAAAKTTFARHGASAMAQLFGKPCLTTCPMHPDNPDVQHPCSLVLDGLTHAGGNCLDKTVYVDALAALHDAMETSDLTGTHAMLAAEGGKVMQLLHELMNEITSKGLMVAVPMVTKDGDVVYDRDGKKEIAEYKANPMIPAYIKLLGDFGISLPEMLATPQSRQRAKTGEQAADTFQTMMGSIMQRGAVPVLHPQKKAIEHKP